MKTVGVSDLRARIADVLEDVAASDEPTIVLHRSRPAAYIVSPEHYERDQSELRMLRRQLFIREVREAEAEYRAGEARSFDDVEDLIGELRA
jgi:prevent-host-death family protein